MQCMCLEVRTCGLSLQGPLGAESLTSLGQPSLALHVTPLTSLHVPDWVPTV